MALLSSPSKEKALPNGPNLTEGFLELRILHFEADPLHEDSSSVILWCFIVAHSVPRDSVQELSTARHHRSSIQFVERNIHGAFGEEHRWPTHMRWLRLRVCRSTQHESAIFEEL
jgi:hypothetical protein